MISPEDWTVRDAQWQVVFHADHDGSLAFETYEAQRLILAAPELLEFAKRVLAADGAPQRWGRPGSLLDAAKALIDRIEEGPSDPHDVGGT
jgi:hypothetical protein